MTKARTLPPTRREVLGTYVRQLADLIGLRDWGFTYADERPSELPAEICAAICPTKGRKWACLWVPDGWWNEKPEERRQTIVHELLHLHTRQMTVVIESVQTNLGDVVWGTMASLHKDAEEYAVDAIADALAPHLPLPPEAT